MNTSSDKGVHCAIIRPFDIFISGPYSSNIRRQHINLSVVKLSKVILLWFVYTVIRCPERIVWNYFSVSTILTSSTSVSV